MALPPEVLERLRERLLRRRSELVSGTLDARRGIEMLETQERGQELEEGAQTAHASFVLQELSESQQREVLLIDEALARMDAGTYGICVDCGKPISEARLLAVPFAIRDAGCQSLAEADENALRRRPSL
ncbi:MAG: TraR/DksA C4-type zinc finger protein [Pseudomonadota bacterium]|nr:MAG: hypothetical protein DIU72_00285 [Pseudomonadota bacterium]